MYQGMRDNIYLENLMYDLWDNYFCDVPRQNIVIIRFGKRSKRQLGCIKLVKDPNLINKLEKEYGIPDVKSITLITVTKYFANEDIPEYVISSTIAHELCHYTHGFNSPLRQIYNKPHQGGVVTKELKRRGLGNMYSDSQKWLKSNWVRLIS